MAGLAAWLVAAASPFDAGMLARLDQAVSDAVAGGRTPGAVLWVEHRGEVHHRAFGRRAVEPVAEEMTEDTVFDVASLTKVVATTPAVMLLVERGRIRLDDPVVQHLPGFNRGRAGEVTVRQLLTHTSGLLVGIANASFTNRDQAIRLAVQERPAATPGTGFAYCDLNFILLEEIVRRVSGDALDVFAVREIFGPLGMRDTRFNPPAAWRSRIAPTLRTPDGVLRGLPQDGTARRMGGVAGHAGVFTTAADLARFARMMLNAGELDGVRLFRPETVRRMTSVQSPDGVLARRGLGWDIDSVYSRPRGEVFPLGSYGHTGWTGASLWLDPFSRSFVILLTNRLHPQDRGSVAGLYGVVGTLAARSVAGFDFSRVPGALPFRTNFIQWTNSTNGSGIRPTP